MGHFPFFIVAIDGGAAAGKSSTARALSTRFQLMHVDTGSYYRAVTAKLLDLGVSPESPPEVAAAVVQMQFGTVCEGRRAQMLLDGAGVPESELRSPAVNAHVSLFAAIPELRARLLNYQRDQARVAHDHGFCGLVMEGRDIGSVIFPDADFRFFLHADPVERARRRAQEGQQDSITERDRLDSTRKASPLVAPAGAIAIDSTHLTLEEVVEQVANLIGTHLAKSSQ